MTRLNKLLHSHQGCKCGNILFSLQHASAGNKNAPRAVNKDISAPVPDKRLFVRLPQEHEWRKLSPARSREVVVKNLAISPTLIGKIKHVHSGFALSPCSAEAREIILNTGNGLFLSGAKLEPAINWVSVMIPTVPASIGKQQEDVEIGRSILSDEIERVSSVRSTYVKLFGRNKPEAPHRTWIAFFEKAPRSEFRVFDNSGVARNFRNNSSLNFASVVMAITQLKTVQELCRAVTVAQLIMSQIFV